MANKQPLPVILKTARNLFFKDQDVQSACKMLAPFIQNPKTSLANAAEEERIATIELACLVLRQQRQYSKAAELYQYIKDNYQTGYCYLLLGNLHETRNYWYKLYQERQNHWCVAFFGMITRQLNCYPTLFQIRNHIESDIANLISANQLSLLENMLTYSEVLSQLNIETYKFIGRALMNCDRLDQAHTYLLQGQKMLPNDPEIYYHLGQYSVIKHLYDDARIVLNQCLLISPHYYPAQKLLAQLEEVGG